jgi:ubiquinone/menaquinone biosynthesis C-methylase UbiE
MHQSTRKLVRFAQRHPRVTAMVDAVAVSRAKKLLELFRRRLPANGKILDVGAGSGHLTEAVSKEGHHVTALDIEDLRFVQMPLVLADGTHLPFAEASFDAVLLLTVLHHAACCRQPEMLKEAARVIGPGGRIIVLEDTFRTLFERVQTFILDTAMNAEFFGHPHGYRSLEEWKDLFDGLGLRLCHSEEFKVRYGIFRVRHALMVLNPS